MENKGTLFRWEQGIKESIQQIFGTIEFGDGKDLKLHLSSVSRDENDTKQLWAAKELLHFKAYAKTDNTG